MNGLRCPIPHPVSRDAYQPALRSQYARRFSHAWSLPSWRAGLLFLMASHAVAEDAEDPATLLRTGKYVECVDAAAKAIANSEFSEAPRLWKIKAEMELGRYSDALATLDSALKRFSSSIELRWLGREVCR